MSTSWRTLSGDQRERLQAAFVVWHGADMLLEADDQPAVSSRPTFGELVAAASAPGPLPAALAQALLSDPALRADFNLLLRRTARVHVPRAAAASSGALQRRQAGGYSLRLVPSRSGADQVYLLIEVPDGHAPPRLLVVSNPDGTICKEDLPPPTERTIRLLKDANDPLPRTFRQPDSELFLS